MKEPTPHIICFPACPKSSLILIAFINFEFQSEKRVEYMPEHGIFYEFIDGGVFGRSGPYSLAVCRYASWVK